MKNIRLFIRSILNFFNLASIIELTITGYLKEKGWYKSYQKKVSIDAQKQSIPWMTYPCIAYLEKRLNKNISIFEYGSGDSTIWFSHRVKSIDAVEHHEAWHQYVSSKKSNNMEVLHVKLDKDGAYCRAISSLNKRYDLVIVDGRDRNNCIKQAVHHLTEAGIILLDNSERSNYIEGIAFLKAQGFKQLEFEGMSPVVTGTNETSLFYKANNCLGI
jgi:hypothetical protein